MLTVLNFLIRNGRNSVFHDFLSTFIVNLDRSGTPFIALIHITVVQSSKWIANFMADLNIILLMLMLDSAEDLRPPYHTSCLAAQVFVAEVVRSRA